jgi:ankyrin repeat protein
MNIVSFLKSPFTKKSEKARSQLQAMGLDFNEASFFKAVRDGNTEAIALFLQAEMDINAKDAEGRTALAQSVLQGNPEIVETLIRGGANPNQADSSGKPPILHTIDTGNAPVAEALVRGGANVDARNNAGFSAVMLAVQANQIQILAVLIKGGADVNVKNHETGQTALMLAAWSGSYDMVDLLLKNAITAEDRDAVDKKGMSALFYAVESGHLEVVKLLCSKKANVNLVTRDGVTPLMLATNRGHVEIARLLDEQGAKE